jgi:transcriptional regulator with XRE-family HTH domain
MLTAGDDSDLGERIKRALQDKGETHEALAESLGVSVQAVGKWIRTGHVARKNLVALANALGVSLEWLLTGTGPMYPDPRQLSDSEVRLIEKYRQMTDGKKALLLEAAEAFACVSQQKK